MESYTGSYFHDKKAGKILTTIEFIKRGLKKSLDDIMMVDNVNMNFIERQAALKEAMLHMINVFSETNTTRPDLKFAHGSSGIGKTRFLNQIIQEYYTWYQNDCSGDVGFDLRSQAGSDDGFHLLSHSGLQTMNMSTAALSNTQPLTGKEGWLKMGIPVGITYNHNTNSETDIKNRIPKECTAGLRVIYGWLLASSNTELSYENFCSSIKKVVCAQTDLFEIQVVIDLLLSVLNAEIPKEGQKYGIYLLVDEPLRVQQHWKLSDRDMYFWVSSICGLQDYHTCAVLFTTLKISIFPNAVTFGSKRGISGITLELLHDCRSLFALYRAPLE